MTTHKIFAMAFSKVYPMYVAKAEKKGRSQSEVDEIIRWQTGYTQEALLSQIERQVPIEQFFQEAPVLNPDRMLVTGNICGIRVETIEDPLMKEVRIMDKLIDELAKGKAMSKILRQPKSDL